MSVVSPQINRQEGYGIAQRLPQSGFSRGQKQAAHGNRHDEEPAGTHEIDFGQCETEAEMQHGVAEEPAEHKAQQAVAASAPKAQDKEKDDNHLYQIAAHSVITHDDRPLVTGILQREITMQLNRLAKDVLHQAGPARRRKRDPFGDFAVAEVLGVDLGLRLAGFFAHPPHPLGILLFELLLDLAHLPRLRHFKTMVVQPLYADQQEYRQQADRQDGTPAKHASPFDEEGRQIHLHDVGEGDSAREESHQAQLPRRHVALLPHRPPADIERQEQQQHGNDEVVGHDAGQKDVAEREEEGCEQQAVGLGEAHDFTQEAEQEQPRIDRREEQDHRHEQHGAVGFRHGHQPLIEPIERVEQREEQRMAHRIEVDAQSGDGDPRPAVVTRHFEGLPEYQPEAAVGAQEVPVGVLMNDEGVQADEHQQQHQGQAPLFLSDSEQAKDGHTENSR